ncbi:MAG: hypothetical protein UIL37_03975 [Clostridia bacterium]|nr:hypothetical protein [Clostridia bacterium]
MIRVNIIDDRRIIESVVESPAENVKIAWAQEGAVSPGYCVFTSEGEILTVADKDNVAELLVRAALNHLDLNGIETGFSKNEELFPFLKSIGFNQVGNKCSVNLKTFFKPCGGCKS